MPQAKIIRKIKRHLLKAELSEDKRVCHTTHGNNDVYCTNYLNVPNVMQEIGRLREIAFREAGGGTGNAIDIYSNMKRICFVVDSIFSIGGVQRVTAVIAKELAKDHDVSIVTFDKSERLDKTLYNLGEADIKYRFVSYPKPKQIKK